MGKKIRVWDGTAWQDVAPSLPYTAIHSAQASMPATGVDGQVWLDTDGTLAGQDFVPLSGGTMTGNLNTPSINSGPIVGRNRIINGDMGIWQRGTSFTGTAYDQLVADRFFTTANSIGSLTTTREAFSVGSAPTAGYESQYFLRYSLAQTGSGGISNQIYTKIEDARAFSGQTVTFSFWAKASSAYSASAFIDRWYGSGGSAIDYNVVIGSGLSISTTWQRLTITATIPSLSGKTVGSSSFLRVGFTTPSYATVVVDTWGWQLEAGNQATPFHTATPNQQTELAACQRYYYRAVPGISTYGLFEHFGVATSSTTIYSSLKLPVTMRTNPSSVDFSTLRTFGQTTGVYNAISNVTINAGGDGSTSPQLAMLLLTSTGLTTNAIYGFGANNSTSAYIGVSAEL
jgi:hypothetical protein